MLMLALVYVTHMTFYCKCQIAIAVLNLDIRNVKLKQLLKNVKKDFDLRSIQTVAG